MKPTQWHRTIDARTIAAEDDDIKFISVHRNHFCFYQGMEFSMTVPDRSPSTAQHQHEQFSRFFQIQIMTLCALIQNENTLFIETFEKYPKFYYAIAESRYVGTRVSSNIHYHHHWMQETLLSIPLSFIHLFRFVLFQINDHCCG